MTTMGEAYMRSNLIRIAVVSAFTFASAMAFAQNAPRNDDPNGAAMDRQSDQSPSAKKPHGNMQKQTNPQKNGTSQSESRQGNNKNGQAQ